jgi:alkanesulfonate monooxygenase SsuD/methylene tetrahydromethanopterin reductase-like flavin-dependent oxidoreductase (luciferase family)
LIGGGATPTLRVVAEHADLWNIPGPPHGSVAHLVERSARLDEHCRAIGRDPGSIVHSAQLIVSYADPEPTRAAIRELAAAGFSMFVLALPTPYPKGVAGWATEEIIGPVTAK